MLGMGRATPTGSRASRSEAGHALRVERAKARRGKGLVDPHVCASADLSPCHRIDPRPHPALAEQGRENLVVTKSVSAPRPTAYEYEPSYRRAFRKMGSRSWSYALSQEAEGRPQFLAHRPGARPPLGSPIVGVAWPPRTIFFPAIWFFPGGGGFKPLL